MISPDRAALRALAEEWAAKGALHAEIHATMGTGFIICARELLAFLDAEPGTGWQTAAESSVLMTYMTTSSPQLRDAAWIRTYAARVRDRTAASWETPNTVASTMEDIAKRLEASATPPGAEPGTAPAQADDYGMVDP